MEFIVVITYPEGQQQQVLVKAANRAAAEQAAAQRFGAAGASINATDASQFSSDYLNQVRQSGAVLDATDTTVTKPREDEPDLEPGGGAGKQPTDPNAGQFPKNPDPNKKPMEAGDFLPEEAQGYAAFLRGIGRTGPTTGIAGQYRKAQYEPYKQAYNAQIALDPSRFESGDNRSYENFVAGTQNPYQASLQALQALRGQGTQDRTAAINSYFDPELGQLDDLDALYQSALRGKYGSAAGAFLGRFAPSQDEFLAQFQGTTGTPGVGANSRDYLEFLRQKQRLNLWQPPQGTSGATRNF